jgi:hypothetical protein
MIEANEPERDAEAGHRLMTLLDRQLELYRRLEQLADAQHRAIELEDPRPLMQLLGERQKLTTALTELNAEMTPYRGRWEEIRAAMGPGDVRLLDDRVADVETRLRRILERDEADGRRLAARKARVAQDMGGVDRARRTLAAYGGAGAVSSARRAVLDGTEA